MQQVTPPTILLPPRRDSFLVATIRLSDSGKLPGSRSVAISC